MLTVKKPRVIWEYQQERIEPLWPKAGAHLDLPPQANQKRLDVWSVLVANELERISNIWNELDESESLDWHNRELELQLYPIAGLLNLPPRVVAAARKRVFGSIPPVDEHDVWIYSYEELELLAGAFWAGSRKRLDYAQLVSNAEFKLKRNRAVDRLFRDLDGELD